MQSLFQKNLIQGGYGLLQVYGDIFAVGPVLLLEQIELIYDPLTIGGNIFFKRLKD